MLCIIWAMVMKRCHEKKHPSPKHLSLKSLHLSLLYTYRVTLILCNLYYMPQCTENHRISSLIGPSWPTYVPWAHEHRWENLVVGSMRLSLGSWNPTCFGLMKAHEQVQYQIVDHIHSTTLWVYLHGRHGELSSYL